MFALVPECPLTSEAVIAAKPAVDKVTEPFHMPAANASVIVGLVVPRLEDRLTVPVNVVSDSQWCNKQRSLC